jgi:hypothetical protein
MCIQVVKKDKKLTSSIETDTATGRTVIEYQLDTGASCNVFNLRDYRALGNPPLSYKKLPTLHLYDGTRTKPLGKCEVILNRQHFQFYVVKTNSMSLLSLDACLNLLSVNQEWVNVISHNDNVTLNDLLEQHASVFEGVGCLPEEYHTEVDENASPTQCHNRKVALSMREDLKQKLESLSKNNIITKVEHPTPWISNTLARRKPNGKLRVCIDPANLNKAIKRNHFPMPTLEDVLPELHGAKIFSLCDAKDGFLQVKLDQESSDLTTFWTPFGNQY